jgi:hypothetical protein
MVRECNKWFRFLFNYTDKKTISMPDQLKDDLIINEFEEFNDLQAVALPIKNENQSSHEVLFFGAYDSRES